MRYRIEHAHCYRYSRAVSLEPHLLRLRPRQDCWQSLEAFSILVDPAPAGMTTWTDVEGAAVTQAWFSGMIDVLTITSVSEVTTLKENPFDYLPSFERVLPLAYGMDCGRLIHAMHVQHRDELLDEFVREVRGRSGDDCGAFLQMLMDAIRKRVQSVHREEGAPRPPAATLTAGEGACRDTTLLFMEACRSVGIAARFVSGYFAGAEGPTGPELHAWPEVYIPGGGWRGYELSDGLAVSDRHVALAASTDPALAAPVTGTFRGTGVEVTTEFQVHISQGTTV